jgi:hypothetical protein
MELNIHENDRTYFSLGVTYSTEFNPQLPHSRDAVNMTRLTSDAL